MELARAISLRRLHWVGHVMRKEDDRVLKKAVKRGRRGIGWKAREKMITVDRDAKRMLKCRNWW